MALSNAGRTQEALLQWAGPAGESINKLRANYKDLIDLNSQLAGIMHEESQSVAQRAFIFGLVASAASAGSAAAVAIFFSKRLSPPLEEIEQRARRQIEKFIAGRTAVGAESSTAGPSADEIEEHSVPGPESTAMVDRGPIILLQSAGYLQGSDRSKGELASQRALDSIMDKGLQDPVGNKLVVMTRKGSNLYYRARKSNATVYVLSSSIQSPIETSEEGMLVISINQTSLVLEAIKRTLQESPSATIVLDNATELVHRLGFEKVFALMQNISDLASAFPKCRVILLINRHAHESKIVEALASVANMFVE